MRKQLEELKIELERFSKQVNDLECEVNQLLEISRKLRTTDLLVKAIIFLQLGILVKIL